MGSEDKKESQAQKILAKLKAMEEERVRGGEGEKGEKSSCTTRSGPWRKKKGRKRF